MTIVIGIDPGKTTGYVVINSEKPEVVISEEITDWYQVGERLEKDLAKYTDQQYAVFVVIERFVINAGTHKKTNQEEPRDIIGLTKYLTKKYTDYPAKQQMAAEAKTFATNEKLKRVGFWHVGGEGHANDAFRHALVYMVNMALLDPQLLLDSEEE